MATAHVMVDFQETLEPYERPGYQKLSVLNGLLIGAALALGSWGVEVWRLAGLPVENFYTSLILGSVGLIALCGFTGWLTGKVAKSWLTVLLWFITSLICTLIIGYQPYIGRNLAIWLQDRRAWGLTIFSFENITTTGLLFGGLMIIIALVVLAILQSSRLEQAVLELGDGGRISVRSWFVLLFPMIFVALVAFFTSSMQVKPAAGAVNVVNRAIQVASSTEEDLAQLGIQKGENYGALSGVQDQLTDNYTLRIGEIDSGSSQAFILAEFDNGAWINCRTINNQLSFCFDATPPYTSGLYALISGESPPEDCRGCPPVATEQWITWLQERVSSLGPDPQIERLAQWGGFVLVKASSTDGDYVIECLFDKMSPVQLARCQEK